MTKRVIGLDVGSASIKACQVLRNPDGTFVIEKQAYRPVPRGAIYDGRIEEKERERLVEILAELVETEKFATKDVIFGVNSSSAVFMDQMDLPMVEERDYDKSIPLLIEAGNDGLLGKDSEVDFSVVGPVETEDGPRLRVLVFRVFEECAVEMAEVIEKAGLNVVGTDINALAALRAIAVSPRPRGQVDALVDIGANVMTLMIHHSGVPKILTLDPDNAGEIATAKVRDALNLDEGYEDRAEYHKINDEHSVGLVTQARNEYSKSLAARVANVFRTHVERDDEIDSIAAVTLLGGGSNIAGIGYYLNQALGEVPLLYAQFDPRFTTESGAPIERRVPNSGDYLVAVGLGTGDVF